ncbi:hypothetical protein D3C80_498580 [compost metagenome]|uniref:hypothetical protein n=1 Tax=Pseudomonas sp. TCU-HL1 TaxID=1856685 RepID=UPI00083CFAE6|nr:hypothetical protein [Pseudomonas sp. TCU-HL1]AOE85527.1 hypothetical protein THL1_2979 [Pseudomonas sp. TCU-HL1]AOE85539.1 hypothetical protein THL1_2991 [Pseudomonas sp. TCU-HL1]
MTNLTKPYRVRDEFVEVIKERRISMIVETREDVAEADLVNAVLWKYLHELTTKDVLKYREEVLGKD